MKLIKRNVKTILAFVIGVIISGGAVYAASILANQVTYDNTSSGLTSTTVQGALDELNAKAANSGGVPIDPDTFQTNTAKTVYASNKGICIKRNNKLNCFKINNWAEEQNHIQQVFSDISCDVFSSLVDCDASDFDCLVHSDGRVLCIDNSDDSNCSVNSDGSVNCS